MGSNASTQRVQVDPSIQRVQVDPSCPLCRGLRPREWPANSTRSFVGETIDLYWFPKDIAILQDPSQTCPFCCFIRAMIDHLRRDGNYEWPTTVPVKGDPISDSDGKFSGYYNLSIELRPEYPPRYRNIDIFLDDPRKKLPWLEIRHLPHSPLRELGMEAAVQWVKPLLQKCRKKHNMCGPPKDRKLPKRLVDLVQYPAVRLIETSGQERKEYACLSHLWGEEGEVPAAQSENLAKRLEKGIKCDQLPKLLREALTFVHRLGIRYLWVASLCVQQDNQDDRQEHSSQMGTIFSNAHITIAAARAENASQSLLSNGETSLTYNNIPIILRERPHHPTRYNSTLDMFPLLRRAWAAQEILLSRRVLYVCEGILTYECIEQGNSWSCTCNDDPRREHRCPGLKDPLMGVSLFANPPAHNRFSPWWHVIQYYTRLDLHDEKDRLPALSNIASRFAEQHRNGPVTYAAGLWAEDLPAGLLWHHRYNHNPKPRNSKSTAPSWSWASTVGQAFSHGVDPNSDLYYASVVSVECVPLSVDDPYGRLQWGKLVLTGSCLLPFDLWHRPGTRHFKAVHDGKGGIDVSPEIEIEYRDNGWHAGGQEVEYYGLPIMRRSSELRDVMSSSLGYTVSGLVLRRLKGNGQDTENEKVFERVAFWESVSEKGYWKKGDDEWSGERLDRLLEGRQGETVVIL